MALFFDLDAGHAGADWRDGDNVFAFAADPAQADGARWRRRGTGGGPEEGPAPAGVVAAVVATPEGYDLEAAIPWAVLADNHQLRFPAEVGFTVLLGDPGPEPAQIMWVGTGDDQETWGRLRFEGYVDGDADGWPAVTDCADADPAVHPYATEIAGNGRDEDCDGRDAAGGDPPAWLGPGAQPRPAKLGALPGQPHPAVATHGRRVWQRHAQPIRPRRRAGIRLSHLR